jgi:3-deoxy-D-manno-octulosonic acid kinase
LPEGFVAATRAEVTLVAASGSIDDARQAGLDQPSGWERRLARPAGPAGRGATARVELPSGRAVRIKRLRRGGALGRLWRDRFVGSKRPLDNLRLSLEAARRGVATPAPVALLVARAGAGLVRAWLAVDEIAGASDLRSRLTSGRRPTAAELGAVLRVVRRMHDAGVEHRDLNLGNLLVAESDEPAAFVVDLDRGRLHAGPLPFALRQRSLRRLERSYVKSCHPEPASEGLRGSIYSLYAGEDDALSRRLDRGRRAARVWIGIHRLGWRR